MPARLLVEQLARLLNTTVEGIYVITSLRILKALGHPRRHCTKYYARSYVLRLMEDEAWLAKMTDALYQYKWDKNHGQVKKQKREEL